VKKYSKECAYLRHCISLQEYFVKKRFESSQGLGQGCQIFLGETYQIWGKIFPKTTKYSKLLQDNYIHAHKIYQKPYNIPKFSTAIPSKIGIFGTKIYHLAVLVWASYVLTVEVVNGRHKLILLLRSKTELVRLN
jgi:hypothetical protein